MGYAGSQLREIGNTLTSAQFMDVANPTGAVTLSSIVPINNNGDVAGWWEVGIQFLNRDGSTDDAHNFMWSGEGWEDADFAQKDDEPIPAGQGLWVNNSSGAIVTLRIPAPELTK